MLNVSDEKLRAELTQYEMTGGQGTGYGTPPPLRGEIARRATEHQTQLLINLSRRLEIATWILAAVAVLTLVATILPLITHR